MKNTMNIDEYPIMKEMREFHRKHPPVTRKVLDSISMSLRGKPSDRDHFEAINKIVEEIKKQEQHTN